VRSPREIDPAGQAVFAARSNNAIIDHAIGASSLTPSALRR
jgi:hypothetical protein